MIYYTSDLHLGHANCIKLCNRPFSDLCEMNDALIKGWNSRVGSDDTVYIVGDLIWQTADCNDYLPKLNGRKILIAGNHDDKWLIRCGLAKKQNGEVVYDTDGGEFERITQYLTAKIDGRPVTFCHYPMLEWAASRKYGSKKIGFLIHGHIHNGTGDIYRQLFLQPHALNAGADINNFVPVTFDELLKNNLAFKMNALCGVDRAEIYTAHRCMFLADERGTALIKRAKQIAQDLSDDIDKSIALLTFAMEGGADIDDIARNFSREIAHTVSVLKKRVGETPSEYSARIAQNEIAVRIAEAAARYDI